MRWITNKGGLIPALALVVFLILWNGAVRVTNISPLIVPSPLAVLHALVGHWRYLVMNGSITLLEAAFGFVAAALSAVSLALMFHFSPRVRSAVYPYAIAIKAVPLIALAPIVILWFGTGMTSKVVLAGIISFFPILVNALDGFKSVDAEALDLLESLSASKTQTLRKLVLPNSLPQIFSGLKVASTFAVVGAVVAEFVSADKGIGYVVKSSSYYLDTDLTFAAIAVAALAGIAFFGVVLLIERRVIWWERVESTGV